MSEQAWGKSLDEKLRREHISELNKEILKLERLLENAICNSFRMSHCSFNGEIYEDITNEEILNSYYGKYE